MTGDNFHEVGNNKIEEATKSANIHESYSLHYKLVQSFETGSLVAMEKEGLHQCLDSSLANDVQTLSIATDRHHGVGSLMKNEYSFIEHQYDVWHLAKSVEKINTKRQTKAL